MGTDDDKALLPWCSWECTIHYDTFGFVLGWIPSSFLTLVIGVATSFLVGSIGNH
jgi:hypothetical protein